MKTTRFITITIAALMLVVFVTQNSPVKAFKALGHYRLTVDIAKQLGCSARAAHILAMGSVAPDASYWETAEAHGQTPNCPVRSGTISLCALGMPLESCPPLISQPLLCVPGMPVKDVGTGQRAFFDYLIEKAKSVNDLKETDPGQALYVLGHALHAVQDLASHQGMTNAEHAYRSYRLSDDPDDISKHGDKYVLAGQWTHHFLYAVRDALGCAWEDLRTFSGSCPDADKWDLSKEDTELTWKRYLDYKNVAEAFEKLPVGTRSVMWGNRSNPRDTTTIDAVSNAARETFIEGLGGHAILLDTNAYHIGDGEFEDTNDPDVVLKNKLAGEVYKKSFTSDAEATIRVKICRLYGVDNVDQAGHVEIDGKKVGDLSPSNNLGSFISDPVKIKAGSHTIAIVTGGEWVEEAERAWDADDLVFKGVSIQGSNLKGVSVTSSGAATISRLPRKF